MSLRAEADRLLTRIPEVLQLWEVAVRKETASPQWAHDPLLRAVVPALVGQLAVLLRGDDGMAEQGWTTAARQSGERCAVLPGASLAQLLGEYRVLRRAVEQVLGRQAPLSREVQEALATWTETAMQEAAGRYCLSQRERGRSEEAQHRLLEENARDYAMFLTDCESCITSWSAGAERLTGFTEAEILGQSGKIIFTPEDRAKQEPEKEMEKARKLGRAESERWHLRKDGSRFWGSGIMHAVYDDAGEMSGYGRVFRDRTAERQAEEERKFLLQEAQQELARRQRLESDLRHINERLWLLSEVSSTLLLLQHPEQIVDPVCRRLSEHLGLDVYFNFLVRPDRCSLQLSSSGGVPAETVERLGVIDFGHTVCGSVAQERRRHVSHAVQESMDPILDELRLLGLGLTLVKRLAKMHGGEVTAHSEGPGCGSEFTIYLPCFRAEPAVSAGAAVPELPLAAVRPQRILVVDDNVDATQTLADLLELWGHEARTAFDGYGALAAAAECRPEVVLLDIGLPGLDGYEVARQIREGSEAAHSQGSSSKAEAPLLIAVTGYGQEDDLRRAAEAGFNHHLTKPVGPTALHRLLAVATETAEPSSTSEK